MKTDSLGIPRFAEADLVNLIYNGQVDKCTQLLCEDTQEIQKYNEAAARFGRPKLGIYQPLDVDQEQFDTEQQAEWFMPDGYKNINLREHLISKCNNDAEIARLESELAEYTQRSMDNVLRYMIYLVDFMREHKILWGVGRGSSVASFVLYLIGIHRIHSIQYGLDFHEFMR